MNSNTQDIYIPYLNEDEKLFLNTAAIYSQRRRMSNGGATDSQSSITDDRRHQAASTFSGIWKRSSSISSSFTLSSNQSMDPYPEQHSSLTRSPKAKELDSLIFDQPQRTVRLSLTPGYAN